MRRLALLALVWLAAGCSQAPVAGPTTPASTPPPRPNVLFIVVDDLATQLPIYGNTLVQAPNFERLAARSVKFDHAYAQFPLCNPSRSSFLSGHYPTTTGVLDNLAILQARHPEFITLPRYLRQAGYLTMHSGKLFHGGIDEPEAWVLGGEARSPGAGAKGGDKQREERLRRLDAPVRKSLPRQTEQEKHDRETRSDHWEAVAREESLPDYGIASEAIRLLREQRKEPFFLGVGFLRPHSPFIAPAKYFDLYPPEKIPLPANFAPRPTPSPGAPKVALLPTNGDVFVRRDASPEEARQFIAAYYACISYIDAQLGRVLDALEEEGLAERTVIVLTSDHGYHLGEKGKWSKDSSLYEPVLRVPLLISAPGAYAHGAASPRTVELVDLYPTLMELLGLAPPEGLEGRSLVPLLLDPLAQHNRPAVSVAAWEGTIVGRSIRTERYRLTEWFGGKRGTEFYDYESDPQEVDNQARNPEYRAQRKRLKALLRARAPVPEWDSEPPADESADGPEKN